MTIDCNVCHSKFDVGEPVFEIVNQKTFTAVVVNTATLNKCPGCDTQYRLIMPSFNSTEPLKLAFVPLLTEKEPSRIITLDSGRSN